jgi:dienelactone hydrolase
MHAFIDRPLDSSSERVKVSIRGLLFGQQQQRLHTLIIVLTFLLLASCSNFPDASERRATAQILAAKHQWSSRIIATENFDVMAFTPSLTAKHRELVVFIEGDGFAWRTRSQPSQDPTPMRATGLMAALNHPAQNAAYLARPCQYLMNKQKRNCNRSVWTTARASQMVVDTSSQALDQLKQTHAAESLILVGYSGGGTVAALLAAQRKDVKYLITLAGNLDHQRWTNWHKLTPLSESLNPADFAQQLQTITQYHFVGEQDKVVPPAIAQAYRQRFAKMAPINIELVKGFDHSCCWAKEWPTLWRSITR